MTKDNPIARDIVWFVFIIPIILRKIQFLTFNEIHIELQVKFRHKRSSISK